MICFVALFVLLILSIFSAKYRPLARRALDCVFRKATLRPCETGFDEEVKAMSIAGIMKVSPKAAHVVNRHFEAFSWALTILMVLSIIFTIQGIYYFAIYGNCNGPTGGFCVFSSIQNAALLHAPTDLDGIQAGNASANITLVEFGCYTCPYTKAAEDGVRMIITNYSSKVHYVFKAFPIPTHNNSQEAVVAALCANDQGRYWDYREQLFENQKAVVANGTPEFDLIASNLGLNTSEFSGCLASGKFDAQLAQTSQECLAAGIYGTPTFFVNGNAYVGPTAINDTIAEIQKLAGE
jgi:protein-disulfide isomerase